MMEKDQGSSEPNNHLLVKMGMRLHAAGASKEAADHYREALQAQPANAELWALLGSALRDAGNPRDAVDALKEAHRLAPNDVVIEIEYGAALQEAGRSIEAIDALSDAVKSSPNSVLAHAALADAFRATQQASQAIPHYQKVLALSPGNNNARISLGACYQETGNTDAAIETYREALKINDNASEALTNLGLALVANGELEAAIPYLEKGAASAPNDAPAINALGVARLRNGQASEACELFRQATTLSPNYAEAWSNVGNAKQDQLRLSEALTAHDMAVTIEPQNAELHWNRAMTLLLAGNLADGFVAYEWRKRRKNFIVPRHDSPEWEGEDLTGKHILILAEQGFGDTIQFARYATLLADTAAKVTLACPQRLTALLSTLSGKIDVVHNTAMAEGVDCHTPLMSLPYHLGTTIDTIPNETPYIKVPNGIPPPPEGDRRRIGVCWTGNPDHPDNRHRSCPLAAIAPLFAHSGIEFVSLQFGHGTDDATPFADRLTDWSAQLDGFDKTAAAVNSLDLVITIDTSTAHVAGALGRPTWLLLKFAPDWRWMVDRDDSPWYPSLRLFRQSAPGDWDGVLARVGKAFQEWVNK